MEPSSTRCGGKERQRCVHHVAHRIRRHGTVRHSQPCRRNRHGMAPVNTAPDGFPNRIELSETDTQSPKTTITSSPAQPGTVLYTTVTEVDVDIDRDAFDAVPDSAEVTGKLTVGKAQTQTLTLPILIQPWKPAGSDAVHFAWKLGRAGRTGSKGTLNAQGCCVGESGATVSMIVLAASFSRLRRG